LPESLVVIKLHTRNLGDSYAKQFACLDKTSTLKKEVTYSYETPVSTY